MSQFNREKFISFILDNGVVGFFDEPITLKSGRRSNWYVNWRTVTSDVYLTDRLSDFLIAFVADLGLDHDGFFGVPEGATKVAVISTYKWASKLSGYSEGSHVLSMGRGKPKDHGAPKDRYFVGEPKGSVILVEDVTTTGGSLIRTIDQIKDAGAVISAAVGLTNRMELDDNKKSVADAASSKGVKYYAMSEAAELLPEAVRRFNPSRKIVDAIEKEFEEFGAIKIKLR